MQICDVFWRFLASRRLILSGQAVKKAASVTVTENFNHSESGCLWWVYEVDELKGIFSADYPNEKGPRMALLSKKTLAKSLVVLTFLSMSVMFIHTILDMVTVTLSKPIASAFMDKVSFPDPGGDLSRDDIKATTKKSLPPCNITGNRLGKLHEVLLPFYILHQWFVWIVIFHIQNPQITDITVGLVYVAFWSRRMQFKQYVMMIFWLNEPSYYLLFDQNATCKLDLNLIFQCIFVAR